METIEPGAANSDNRMPETLRAFDMAYAAYLRAVDTDSPTVTTLWDIFTDNERGEWVGGILDELINSDEFERGVDDALQNIDWTMYNFATLDETMSESEVSDMIAEALTEFESAVSDMIEGEIAAFTYRLRKAGFIGRLRWLLTGKLG